MKKALLIAVLIAIFTVPAFAGVEFGVRTVGTIVVPQVTIDLDQGFIPALTVFKSDLFDGLTANGTYSLFLTWNAPFIVYRSPDFGFRLSFYFGAGVIVGVNYPSDNPVTLEGEYAVLGGKVDSGEAGALFADIMIAPDGSYSTSVGGTLALPSFSLPAPSPPSTKP